MPGPALTAKRYALCIGINQYQPSAYLSNLQCAEKDARAVLELLQQKGFKPEDTSLLCGEQATLTAINDALNDILLDRAETDDLVVLYFAGHSTPITINETPTTSPNDLRSEVFLATYDFDKQKIKQKRSFREQEALGMERLRIGFFERSPSRKVLFIFDSCYSGDFYGPRYRDDDADPVQGYIRRMLDSKNTGRIALSSCLPVQKSAENLTLGHGLFTYHLLEALNGTADALERDGWLTVGSLLHYLDNHLPPEQRPVRSGVEHGSFKLLYFPDKVAMDTEQRDTERQAQGKERQANKQRHREELYLNKRKKFLDQYCFGANIEDFDYLKLKEYVKIQNDSEKLKESDDIKQLCINLGLGSSSGTPTHAAILAFHPSPQRYIHSALIRVTYDIGEDKTLQDDIGGPLDVQVEKTISWLLSKLETVSDITGAGKREERCEIPNLVIREIVTNAVLHRNYEANQSIQVKITNKQVTITNPGRLDESILDCNPVFIYNDSFPQNPLLLQFLVAQKWAEGRGRGFRAILKEFKKYDLELPEINYIEKRGIVQIIIKRPDYRQQNSPELIVDKVLPRQRVCPTPQKPLAPFGGREKPLTELKTRLKEGKLTVVHGLGGIGKTALAEHLAYELFANDKIFKAVLWANVTREPNPRQILLKWSAYAGFTPPPDLETEQLAYLVKSHLEKLIAEECATCPPERTLVVLDDVWDDEQNRGLACVRLLQKACPSNSTVLVISRFQSVAPDLGATVYSLDKLHGQEGMTMLQTYLPEADPALLLDLVTTLDGYTLALKLAALRVGDEGNNLNQTLTEHIAEYKKDLPEGTEFGTLELDRHDTSVDSLTIALSYSYRELRPEEQRRFRLLGVTAYDQPYDNSILAAIWELTEAETQKYCRNKTRSKLRSLSLLELASDYGEGWYSLHPILQTYALALLKRDVSEYGEALRRYQEQVIKIAEQFNKLPPEEWGQLTPYLPHILAVGDGFVEQTASLETIDDEGLIRLAQSFAINTHWYVSRRMEVMRDKWLEMGLVSSRKLQDQKSESLFLNDLAVLYSTKGEKGKALEYYEQALPIDRSLGDWGDEATTLNNMGLVYSTIGEKEKALEYYEQALPLIRAVGDRGGEATTLNNMGLVYSTIGEKEKALEYYEQALPIHRAVGDRGGEATTLNNMGSVYDAIGEKEKALEYYEQALPLIRAVGDRGGEATTLNNIGSVYDAIGEKEKALEYLEQALPLVRAVGNRGGEAATLNNMGNVYNAIGEKEKALEYYEQALTLRRAVGDRGGEATTFNNMGSVYDAIGEKEKALEYFQQALTFRRAVGDRGSEAATLNNMGSVYNDLGEKEKALEYYEQALPIHRAVGNRGGEAATLNNMGSVYDAIGEKEKALEYYEQALPLVRAVGNRGGEATTLNNMGNVYDAIGEMEKALEYYEQALPIHRAVGNRNMEATTLNNMGLVYNAIGEKEKALEYYEQALTLRRAVGDRGGEAYTLHNMGLLLWQMGQRQEGMAMEEQSIALLIAVKSPMAETGKKWLRQMKAALGQS
jgi:tetratricopeptide (TPR) repeat protein